jgi:hypothetical protein
LSNNIDIGKKNEHLCFKIESPIENRKPRKGEIQLKGVTEPAIQKNQRTRFIQQSIENPKTNLLEKTLDNLIQ